MPEQHSLTAFCTKCTIHTPHTPYVDRYGSFCNKCGTPSAGIDNAVLEERFTTPDGQKGRVVENNQRTVIFKVDTGDHAGIYVYDKNTGFGGIQEHTQ